MLRATRLIGLADRAFAALQGFRARAANAITRKAHPEIAFPPAALVHEVQGYATYAAFLATGERHASVLASIIDQHSPPGPPRALLEWGCGPGRLLRPLSAHLTPADRLFGCDPNPACVAAAKKYAPSAHIVPCAMRPPAPFPSESFTTLYGVSILTHLDEAHAQAWVADLARLLKPGGVAILTTHGGAHAARLTGRAKAMFDAGRHVALMGARQGSRTLAAYTPVAAMTAFASANGLTVLDHHTAGPAEVIGQDVWVLKKP